MHRSLPLLTRVLELDDAADVAGLEDPQGEPLTAFFEYEQDSIVLVDSSWDLPPEISSGSLSLRLLTDQTTPFRAVVLELSTAFRNYDDVFILYRPAA